MKTKTNSQKHLALANSRYASALAVAALQMNAPLALSNDIGNMTSGTICLANDSLLRQVEMIEELTAFAASYDSMVGNRLARLRDFLAPPRPSNSRIVRLTTYDENEPWQTVDFNLVKRGLLGDFAEVRQRVATKTDFQINNRGLTVILDRDELKDKPEWQQLHTKWLIDLLNRATVLEAMNIYTAAAVLDSTTWDNASNPDLEIRTRLISTANTTGFYPQNVAYGDSAHLKRQTAYENQLTAGSISRSASYTEQDIARALGVSNVLINAERYQSSAAAKTEIIGQNVLIFTGVMDAGPMDPSNLVRHVANSAYGGGDYAVYISDLGIKKIALTVENYEYLHVQHTTGIEKLQIN
jgi:hypothetical protein